MIFESPFPEVEIPDVPVTSHVLRRVDELADRTALIDAATGRTLSFGEIRSAIRRTAGGWRPGASGRVTSSPSTAPTP